MVLCRNWSLILTIGIVLGYGFVAHAEVDSSEFLPANMMEDPWPQPPFAHEVEVTLRPVMATQVLGEDMPAILSMRNLSHGMVGLPHQWGDSAVLMDLRFSVDPAFAARHGITIGNLNGGGLGRFLRLRPDEISHTRIRINDYLTFTNPIQPPVPITWTLWLRNGEEKSGHFLLHIQMPKDPLDEIMEQHQREQDKDLPSLIELPELPEAGVIDLTLR